MSVDSQSPSNPRQSHHGRGHRDPPAWPQQPSWPQTKRRVFGMIGVGLILGGIYTILRGLVLMSQFNGEVADLGAGPGAVVVGVMCVALAYHPRSPLNKMDSGI